MPSRTRRVRRPISSTRRTAATLALALALTFGTVAGPWPRPFSSTARAQDNAPLTAQLRRPIARDASSVMRPGPPEGRSAGWWLGTAGVALALAVCGWVSVAARRYLPRSGTGPVPLRVVGRTSLSPKHTVYLLEVGERVLIVGAGPQGAPSLLGELDDPEESARVTRSARPHVSEVLDADSKLPMAPVRFDHRLGDEA